MKLRTLLVRFAFVTAIVIINSCEGEVKKKNTSHTDKNTEKTNTTESEEVSDTYYVWVDKINVRDTPSTKGKVVGTYTNSDIIFQKETSETKETIVLRGVAYEDYWLKVTTSDQKEGWIYGGAVKKEGDDSGNDVMTDDKFEFDHFGKFDLSTWTDLGVTNRESGDAETSVYSYAKDGKVLEIEKTNVGEYGYYHTYKLLDKYKNILKERSFDFVADVGNGKPTMELKETVKDYQTKKLYQRKQNLSKHFMQLNARPIMIHGEWTQDALVVDEKTETQ